MLRLSGDVALADFKEADEENHVSDEEARTESSQQKDPTLESFKEVEEELNDVNNVSRENNRRRRNTTNQPRNLSFEFNETFEDGENSQVQLGDVLALESDTSLSLIQAVSPR